MTLRLRPQHRRWRRAPGFTLVEMLVALAITLIMMSAVVSLFGLISDNVSGSRSVIELSERLRAARNRLQADLQGVTATMQPPLRPGDDEGYFELIEGPIHDEEKLDHTPVDFPRYSAAGDVDDVLMFTTRSRGEPFVGLFTPPGLPTRTVESQIAEVMYFCAPAVDATGREMDPILYFDSGTATPIRLYTLYRRVLLVLPSLNRKGTFPQADLPYFVENDISARLGPTQPGPAVPNSLGDLTKRENRFAHHPVVGSATGFPFNVQRTTITAATGFGPDAQLRPFEGERLGDDVLLTNVLAFDVQVFDPGAPVEVAAGFARTPEDPGYNPPPLPSATVFGAYANLGSDHYTRAAYPNAQFCRDPNSTGGTQIGISIHPGVTPGLPANNLQPELLNPVWGEDVSGEQAFTYDTWSMHYENNGIREHPAGNFPSGASRLDAATNGLDDDGNNIVDDLTYPHIPSGSLRGEAETAPPFPAPLRGIRIRVRVYEPDSKQVRQVTVVQDFLPE